MPDPDETTQFLRCTVCGRLTARAGPELAALIADGWPGCCGKPMAMYVDAVPPKSPPGSGPV